MTPSPARPGALLRAQALRPQAGPRLRAHLHTAAGTACAVLLGLLAVLLLAPGGMPSLASVTSRPSVVPSVPFGGSAGSPVATGVADELGAPTRSLR